MAIKSNTKFCHYTTLENARSILSGECFFLSPFEKMNDGLEVEWHKDDKESAYVLSFCNSESLNIPMFYLYGGIDGKGCRIQFTDTKINEIVDNCRISYVNKQHKLLKTAVSSSSYEIHFDWVYYVTSDGWVEHRTEGKLPYKDFKEAMDELKKESKHFFIKNKVWNYENEFRIIVVFKEKIRYDNIAIRFNVKEKDRGISMFLGPEMDSVETESVRKEFTDYGITEDRIICDNKHPLKMNLVERNRRLY